MYYTDGGHVLHSATPPNTLFNTPPAGPASCVTLRRRLSPYFLEMAAATIHANAPAGPHALSAGPHTLSGDAA